MNLIEDFLQENEITNLNVDIDEIYQDFSETTLYKYKYLKNNEECKSDWVEEAPHVFARRNNVSILKTTKKIYIKDIEKNIPEYLIDLNDFKDTIIRQERKIVKKVQKEVKPEDWNEWLKFFRKKILIYKNQYHWADNLVLKILHLRFNSLDIRLRDAMEICDHYKSEKQGCKPKGYFQYIKDVIELAHRIKFVENQSLDAIRIATEMHDKKIPITLMDIKKVLKMFNIK